MILLLLLIPFVQSLPFYHQSDYNVKPEIVEVVFFDKEFYQDGHAYLAWHNRTTRILNATFRFVKKNPENNFPVSFQVYKFMSNEYRFFPITLQFDFCKEYYRNNFNLRELLDRTSNIRTCPLKQQVYYIRNAMLDFSSLPAYIPRGRYKVVATSLYKDKRIGEMNAYGSVVDKPDKWAPKV